MTTTSATEDTVLSISTRRLIRDKQALRTIFLRVSQFVTWPISFIFFNLIYRLQINGRENLNSISSPLIIIANHITISASFLFRVALGFGTPHLPLRFMGVRQFNGRFLNFMADIGVVDFVYSLFGVFTIVPGRGLERNLEEAKRILKSRGNVVIYPEGRLESRNVIGPFHSGASVLARQTGAPVLPISFRLGRRGVIRRKMIVSIGKPMQVNDTVSVDEITLQFRDSIVDLYNSKK